jgi:glucose-6-phosphate isomerase, archaeal
MEFDLTKLTPDVRHLNDMREVLYDKDFSKNSPDMDLYYMYKNLKLEDGLKYNITITLSKMLGFEFNKTAGHYHMGPMKELYNVMEGEAIFLMQKGNAEKIEDVYVVKAKAGESAFIKSDYGHVTINPSDKDLKTQDWSPIETKSDYSLFKEMQGACYYYVKDESGEKWIKNENYKSVPEIRFEEPIIGIPEDLNFLK